ncbi:maestro heat-like repeat-containing protein family member 1 [Mauremys reevesii]|uniref:maestro heat-like repeat-containing protein family member 1 n=1 Tax=Mauremys reevesii TaxID=260615 RepID=UPI00193F046C|nr:maestro heat-like repeat-containing protein family member 1 [Mauremys reevesii]
MDEAALRTDIGTLPALHSMVCHLPREHLEERREALDSLVHLARLFLLKLLVFLFRRLNKDEEEEACGSLFILDRIVQSNISEMTHHTEKLFTAVGPILQSTSIQVREALASFIRTMGAHGLLEKSASRPFIDFLVRQCTLILDSTRVNPRSTLPQELLARLLPPEELARHIPHVHCTSTQHLSAFHRTSELSEPATFLAPLILGLDQVPQHKLVQPLDGSNISQLE